MKTKLGLFLAFVILLGVFQKSVLAGSAEPAFRQLLSLEGEWEGEWKGENKSFPMRLIFTPISEKAALMETLHSLADNTKMVTIYHQDGDQLMATHYCRFNNQPRMTAPITGGVAKKMEFQFLDGRNLSSSHVNGIVFEFIDENTIIQTYNFKGMEGGAAVTYKRVK